MDWAVGEDWPAFSQRLHLPKCSVPTLPSQQEAALQIGPRS